MEIKFRGKRLDNGEWVYGYLVKYGFVGKEKYYIVPSYASALYAFEVDPATVGQLLHKLPDGTEVYKGDILHIEIHDHWTKKVIASANEVVDVQDCKIGVKWGHYREFSCLTGFGNTTMTLAGNVHDNPELLEEPPC